jgi:hypothetical protein
MQTMQATTSPLTLELLTWIASRPRTYDEAMDAWRSNCPRHAVWEDACIDGLVEVVRNGDARPSSVVLTALGRTLLAR